jgi:tyrosine-protein phosphatase SIW14
MRNALRWALGAFAVAVALAPPAIAYRAQYLHQKRFREVEPAKLYRSGQMTANGFREAIEKYGIRTVVNLQHENPDPLLPNNWLGKGVIHERALCEQLGVKYVLITPDVLPPGNTVEMEPEAVREWLSVLADESNYPILLHCKAGLHRTGRLTAIYRMEKCGWDHGAALRELRANGYGYVMASERDDFIVQFVQNYKPRGFTSAAVGIAGPIGALVPPPEGGRK